MRQALVTSFSQMGEILQRDAVKAIQDQMPPDGKAWEPLKQWYLQWKEEHKYSTDIYIMTSSYIQAITWKFEDTDRDMQLIVGVMRNSGPHPRAKMDIWQIAEILEYGWDEFDVWIPPRPLWRPLLQVNKRRIQTRVGTAIYWAAKKIERMASGTVTP